MNTLQKSLAIIVIGFGFYSCSSSGKKEYAIAYNVLLNQELDNYEVFTMNLDGTGKANVTNLPGVEWTYLSVADQIYFISDKDTCKRCYFLYRMNADGSAVQRVADFQLRDSWMSSRKNGTELIVTPHPKVDSVFYIINQQGKILNRIQPGLPYFNDPAFSPDGKKIVFRGATKKFKRDSGFVDELYLMNDDGTDRNQLTHYPVSDTSIMWYSFHAGPPMWHPVEDLISYQSFQNGKYSLYAVTPDGNRQWKLTDNPVSEGWHAWSPDGKWLAIELFDTDEKQFHIGLMNWQTKEMTTLTDTTFTYQQSPNFVIKN